MPMDKNSRKAWQIHNSSGSGELLGETPYTESGFRRTGNSLLGDSYQPIGSKMYGAKQDEYNLQIQQQAMGLTDPEQPWTSKAWGKLKDLGKWGLNSPAARGAMWVFHQLDRVPNAFEGTLEQMRDDALASPETPRAMDTLKSAGRGMRDGFLQRKDYNFGRWLEKLGPDSEVWQDITRTRPIRMIEGAVDKIQGEPSFLDLDPDQMRGKSGPQEDPEYSGFKNMTIGDIASLLFNVKATVTPKLGRVTTPVSRGTGAVPEKGLRRAFQLDVFGKHFTPAQNAQFKAFDALGEGGRKALSHSPAAERFLSHFSNRVESTNTRGAAKAFDVIDNSRQGFQMGVKNFKARMEQAFEGMGIGKANPLSDSERTLAYYSAVTGRAADDPELLQLISTHYKVDPAQLAQGAQRATALRDWWLNEAQQFKTSGETRKLFRGIDTDYAPIRFKKDLDESLLVNNDDLLGKEFSGLRGIQKHRGMNLTDPKKLEWFVKSGAMGDLAFDKLDDAANFYARVYHGLERHQNILDGLEGLGLVRKGPAGLRANKPPQGWSDLAKVLEVNPAQRTAQGLARIDADQYFVKDAYKQRLVDELFGYGGGGGINKMLKGLSRIQDPWKMLVTTFSPRYHINNALDDIARNYWFGNTGADDFTAAVSRGTGNYVKGATVKDWTLRKSAEGLEQWHHTPGSKQVMDLTQEQASNLAQAMGVSTVQTTDEIAMQAGPGLFGGIKRGLNNFRQSSERLQGVQREANFMSGLRQHGDSSVAKAMTDMDLINYRDISPFMRDVVRPFAPFSTFRTKNPGTMLNQMVMNPKQFGQIAGIQQAVERTHGAREDQSDLNLPQYYRDRPVFAWNDPGKKKLNILDMGLSQFDAQNLLPGERMKDTLRRLPGPAVQIPLGLITGKDALGRDIGDMKESKWIDGLLFGQKGEDGKQYTPGQLQFIIDSLTGTVGDYHRQGETPGQSIDRLTHLTGQTFDSDVRQLQVLLEQNRMREAQLLALKMVGTEVPKASTLKQPSTNSLLR